MSVLLSWKKFQFLYGEKPMAGEATGPMYDKTPKEKEKEKAIQDAIENVVLAILTSESHPTTRDNLLSDIDGEINEAIWRLIDKGKIEFAPGRRLRIR